MYKVSVLVPVYNTEKTLSKCLDSILEQTMIDDIEIVIVNDGSTDNSQNIIDKYVSQYKNIIEYKQKNQGLGATRNKGIELASGEYIAFLDSDDWADKDYYELMYKKAKEEDSELVISSYIVEIPNTNTQSITKHKIEDKISYLNELLKGNIDGFSWNKLYKKSLITDNKLKFPLRGELENVEDQYFSLRCVALANNISFMNDSNIHYIIHSQSIVRKYQDGLYNDILNLYKSNKEFLLNIDEFNYDIKDLDILLIRGLITIINNEFKPERKVDYKEKKDLIKKVINIKEYKDSIKNMDRFKLSKINSLYIKLIKNKMINTVYIIAMLRCKRMHSKSKVYS